MSGSGKTTITLGFISALIRRGLIVQPYKTGPDFIDPGHHSAISGRISRNLDGWMLSKAYNRACFYNHAQNADVALVEGVMGVFDGYDGRTESGSSAEMAKWLNIPAILIVNAKSMARSAAAVVKGFELFDPDLRIAGVLFNGVSSNRHLDYLTQGMEGNSSLPVLGGIPRDESIMMPERHLGLFTNEDHPISGVVCKKMADLIEKSIDLNAFLNMLPDISGGKEDTADAIDPPSYDGGESVRIGVARDNAFCFYYEDNLDHLKNAGAEIIFFSPVNDGNMPKNLSGLYFGGGYPELFADKLSSNIAMRNKVYSLSRSGMPIYAECGGFMYLTREIATLENTRFPMVGCFDVKSEMLPKFKALGYREITLEKNTLLGVSGGKLRGHEFHYSRLSDWRKKPETVYRMTKRTHITDEPSGFQVDNTLGSYVHLHFGSNPFSASAFVDQCRKYKKRLNGAEAF